MKIPNTNSILITARRAGKSFLAGLCLALAARDVSGQSAYTWNGGSGSTGNWSDGANWGGTGPANPQAFLNFNGATRTSNTNDFAAASAGYQIYFKSGANAFNLYGNSITFFDFGGGVNDPNIQNEGAVTNQTINFPIANGNNNGTFHVLNLNLNTGTSQGPLTFNGPVSSADAGQPLRVINVYGPSAIAFNGVISDFDSTHKLALSQLGSGTTTLTASNTFTGDMTVNAGTLLLATNNALANGGNFIRLGDTAGTAGANLNLNGGNSISTPINVRSGSSGTKIIANTSGSVGTATFGGNLFLDADATLFANAGGNNLSGSTLDLKNQTLTIDGTGSNIISGALTNSTGAGKLVKNGTGTLYLSAANTFSGGTTLSNGIIQVNNNAGFGTGTVTANSGANNGRILLNGVIISNNVTMTTANPGTATGVIQGVDNTSSTNLGTVTINTNAGTGGHFYGPTTSGLLTIAGPVNLVSPATTLLVRDGYVQFSGGGSYTNIDIRNRTNSIGANNGISTTAVLEIAGNGSTTVPTAFDLNGFNQTLAGLKNSVNPANLARITNSSATLSTLTLAVSNLQVFSGSIVGNLAVNLTGGTQVYSNGAAGGTYAYTGDTTISGGTLNVAAANLLPNGLTRGNMIVTNTGLLDLNTFSQTVNSLAGNGTVDTVAGGSPTLTIGVSNSVISTFSGIIKNTAGALSITKSGSNTFILTGTNNATGQVFIDSNQNSVGNDGIFRLAYPGALNGPTNIVVRNQNSAYSTFQLDGTLGNLIVTNLITLSGRNNTNAPTIESIAGNNTISGNYAMTVGGSAYWIQNDAGTLTNSGAIPVSTPGGTRFFTFTGAGNHWISGTIQNGTGGDIVTLIKDGSGTATLTAANTFSGTNRIPNGTEIIANALALQLCTVEMNAADTGTLNLNNLNATLGGLSGTRNLALGTGTISVGNNNSNTIYSGSLSGNALTKVGTGTLTLSGNNTYTGATTISAGELLGQTGGSISNNTVSVSAGATNGVLVAVTNGQWVCGALTYSSGSTYADFNFNGNAPSTNTAPLLVNGNLAFTVAPTVIVRSSAAVPPGTYPLFKYSGTLSGTAPTTLILPPNMVATLVNNTGNKSVDLNVTVGNQLTWVGGVNTNWDIATTANWKNTSGTTVSYTDGSAVLFDDTSSVTNINVAATVAPGSITFSNSTKNYTFTNGVIGGSGSLTKNGAATLALMTNNAYSGNTVFNPGTLTLSGINPLGIGGTVTFNGGTVQFAAPTISNNIVVPNGATVAWVKTVGGNPPSTTLSGNLSGGGTINESGNINGFNLNGNNSGFTGVMNSGNNGSTHRWRFNNANAGSASAAWSLNTVATDAYGFNFSTATIFFGSLSGSGTFRNDLAGTVTLSVGALNTDATFSGTIIANGTSILALTKTGTGTFTLTGGNPYKGSTTITGGRLAITTANLTGAGAISINDAGRLNIAVGSVLQMPVGTLTLGSVTGSTNEFAGLSSTNAAPINATNLTLNGANVFNIISGGFVAGRTYPLIAFAATNGTGSVQLGSVPSGLVATLGTNVINGTNTIALTVTAVGSSVDVWSGKTSGTWNSVTTGNWTNSGVAVVYADGDNVQFDDTASAFTVTTASSNFLAYVSPASIVVSNTANTYTFNGIPIALGGTLTKAGTGTLTVNTVNTGFGSINLNAGTINQGNGASLGLGTLTMSNGTTFTLPSNGSTFAVNPIVIAGGSTVTLSSGALGNGYSGTVTGDSASVINIATAVSFNTATPQFDSFPGTVNVTSAGTVRFSSTTGSNGGSKIGRAHV